MAPPPLKGVAHDFEGSHFHSDVDKGENILEKVFEQPDSLYHATWFGLVAFWTRLQYSEIRIISLKAQFSQLEHCQEYEKVIF